VIKETTLSNPTSKRDDRAEQKNDKATGSKRPVRKRAKRRRRKKSPSVSAPHNARQQDWDPTRFDVPQVEGKTRFQEFDLPEPLLHAIYDLGFEYCTPIQAELLPSTLAGKDATGRAQTGTGKTAAFLITVITRMLNDPLEDRKTGMPRVLVLAPTRELVLQISAEAMQLSKYTAIKTVSVFGGTKYDKQHKQLHRAPVDIVVATPGRLLDNQRRRDIYLKKVEVLIIDEADRMLDMGFIPDVRKIVYSTPDKSKRQTLFFSATLPEEVTRLASQWTRNPVNIQVEPEQVAVETVEQIIYIVTSDEKFALLYNIIHQKNLDRVLVFCNRRDQVRRLAELLERYGTNCAILSGEVPQNKRMRRLNGFKEGKIRVLVATDVAGRGIHIEGMDHVINFTLPRDPEDYVHRIGRTGRAGASGTSVSFADEEDAFYIPDIETFTDRKLSCIEPDPEWLVLPEPVAPKKKRRFRPKRRTGAFSRRKSYSGSSRRRQKKT